MSLGLTAEDIGEIRRWADRNSQIRRVFLFGSRARGDHISASDIDLAIEVVAEDVVEAQEIYRAWVTNYRNWSDLRTSEHVHLEWYHPDAGLDLVGPAVQQDGIVLYERASE